MNSRTKTILGAVALASAAALSSLATAQPLAVTVNPLAIPGAILGFPEAGPVTDTDAAVAAAVGYTPEGYAIIPAAVLRQVGPSYVNPPGYRRTVVLRRGSVVPDYVPTALAENISVRGLVPNADYDYFISPQRRIVFLDQDTRRVVRIVR